MKKYLYLPIVLSIFISTSFGQSNSFKTQLPDMSWGQSVLSDYFETYLVTYLDSSNAQHLVRIDKEGKVLWNKKINYTTPDYFGRYSKPIRIFGHYATAWQTDKSPSTDSVVIALFNFYGEVIKQTTITYNVSSIQLFQLSNGNILCAIEGSDSKSYYLIELGSELNILRSKTVNFNDYLWNEYISATVGNKLFFATGSYLGYLDEELNFINILNCEDRIKNIVPSFDGNIIVNSIRYFIKVALDGSIIWKFRHSFTSDNANLIKTTDGVYHCFYDYGNYNTTFDENGNIIINRPSAYGYFSDVSPTLDNGFIGIGQEVRKFDQNGNLFFLIFTGMVRGLFDYPYDSVKVRTPVFITWESGLPGKVAIELSVNDGSSWDLITDSIDAVNGQYYWVIPDKISNNCKIKITSVDHPQYSVESNLFRIISQDENFIAINNLKLYYNIGKANPHDPYHAYLYWPGGERASTFATYSDGLYWSGTTNNEVRVGGKHFITNLQAGNIITPDSAADPNEPRFQSWRFRKNWESLPDGSIKSRYQNDYENWPIELGAPWIDNNYDGIYNIEDGDKPDTDADELHWMVMNDMSYEYQTTGFESPPMGIEVQLSIYGYKQNNFLDDVLFKRYLLINKSNEDIQNIYLCYFADNDFGYSHDDFVGCDTTLNLGFTWNAYEYEDIYGFPPPAMGHMIVQGPIVNGEQNESAVFKGIRKNGYKNLSMSAFGANYKNDPVLPRDPANKMDYVNLMIGLNNNGSPIIDPTTGKASTKHVYGDPETGTGWIDGTTMFGTILPADRRYYITTGPFNLASQDTQEIVITVLATKGTSNKNSVTELKKLASNIREFYYSKFPTDVEENAGFIPNHFQLNQNYPNPFNPSTTIEYTIPTSPFNPSPYQGEGNRERLVTLKVYDILGREVKILVNEKQSPGKYKVVFDGKHLSSGVYFYQLVTNNFSQTRKMILIK